MEQHQRAVEEKGASEGESHGYVCRTLADLPPRTVLDTGAVSKALGVDVRTIKRMVERGELPPPTPWAGRNCWTAGKILDFLERRLERAEHEAERRAKSHRVA